MSMEAKASAVIIGSLPFIVAFLVQIASPASSRLVHDADRAPDAARLAFWMMCGIIMMKSMIIFEI